MKPRESLRDDAMFRMGTAMLGMFAGAAIGALTWLPIAYTLVPSLDAWAFVAATTVSGLVCGALMPYVGAAAFEGLLHFFAGTLAAVSLDDWPEPSENSSSWLRAAFTLGLCYAVSVWLVLEFWSRLR